MIQHTFAVTPRLGIHARPAAMLVQLTTQFHSSIKIQRGDQIVDGKSIMGIMMLAAEHGSELIMTIEGDDEQKLLESLIVLFKNKFDEE